MRLRSWFPCLVTAALLASTPLAQAGSADPPPAREREASRGELLYETRCGACHTSVMHVRRDHRATSAGDVYDWVRHWADYQKLGWSDDDVADVSDFLVKRYYRFDRTTPAR